MVFSAFTYLLAIHTSRVVRGAMEEREDGSLLFGTFMGMNLHSTALPNYITIAVSQFF